MRRHITIKPWQWAKLNDCGIDAAYEDIRRGGIDSIRIGQRKIRIPVTAAEKRLGVGPGELDHLIDEIGAGNG
ncbi:MAG: hypothetical protein HOH20_12915 [Rhodospirillaceae bacterium]|jgi:hypothetical protein|nr:hypothetical protein [Rhodospirillaceae bacterium]MBT6090473.1 hypothetical protein [Rhodospirillaceae bacterium]